MTGQGLDRTALDVHANVVCKHRTSTPDDALAPLGKAAHTVQMAADDDPQGVGSGRPDGSLGPWPEVTIPDDLSELAADIATYRAERRAAARRVARARRRARAHPLWRWAIPREKPIAAGFTGTRPGRLLLPLAMTGIALVLCAIVTVLLTMFAPSFDHGSQRATPLASGVGVYPSDQHGLLPDVQLPAVDGSARAARALRPGVVLVLPAGCACGNQIGPLARDAVGQELNAYAIVGDNTGLTQASGVSDVTPYRDPGGQLSRTFAPNSRALHAVIVDSDGRVLGVLTGSGLNTRLVDRLQQLFATR